MSSFQSEGRKLEKLVAMPKKELQRYTIAERFEHKQIRLILFKTKLRLVSQFLIEAIF